MLFSRGAAALLTTLTLASLLVAAPSAAAQEAPGPIRLIPQSEKASIRLDAQFTPKPELCAARQPRNLHAAYPGILEIGRRADGKIYLVSELSFSRYLKGIAEVPRDWPAEALKAQVVAARTYAISHMNPNTALARELRYNLCSTDACQVYRGLVVEDGAWGEQWSKAVDETAGEILEYQGNPASTFYFSTSNGQTYSNTEFGGTALPYLKPVTEGDDKQSPYSQWSVRMPMSDLTETLRLAQVWGPTNIEQVQQQGETIVLNGGGQSVSMPVTDFRNKINQQAICLTPKRYPTLASNGRTLPQVIPSKWLQARQDGTNVVVTGRGWGHGVGMVQWGLKGKAERGLNHSQMLAYYYGGLRPVKRGEPESLRVGLAIDIDSLTIERRGDVKVEGAAFPDGPVTITGGERLAFQKGSPIKPDLRLSKTSTNGAAAQGAPANFSFELSSPARISIRYSGPANGTAGPEPRDRGPQGFGWAAENLPAGDYSVTVVASDGVDEVASAPMKVTVTPPPSPSPTIPPSPIPLATPEERSSTLATIFKALGVVGAVLLFLGGALLIVTRRRQSGR